MHSLLADLCCAFVCASSGERNSPRSQAAIERLRIHEARCCADAECAESGHDPADTCQPSPYTARPGDELYRANETEFGRRQ